MKTEVFRRCRLSTGAFLGSRPIHTAKCEGRPLGDDDHAANERRPADPA